MNTAQRILASIERNPDATDYKIAKNLGIRVEDVRNVRSGISMEAVKQFVAQGKKPKAATDGIDLKGLKVLPRKPADSAAGFIKRLPSGRGFEVGTLAAEWGISEETIRRHAKDLKCLKFVEVNDEWLPMIMSPETARKYHA